MKQILRSSDKSILIKRLPSGEVGGASMKKIISYFISLLLILSCMQGHCKEPIRLAFISGMNPVFNEELTPGLNLPK